MSVKDLGLSVRVSNHLVNAGIKTVSELVSYSEEALRAALEDALCRTMGFFDTISFYEITAMLQTYALTRKEIPASIESLSLPVRTIKYLGNANIKTTSELLSRLKNTFGDNVFNYPSFGIANWLDEIKKKLKELNLALGMIPA